MRNLFRSPLWLALVMALVMWGAELGEPIAHGYWNAVYRFWSRPAPQSIVVINSDEIGELGAAGQAKLIALVQSAKPQRIVIDTKLQYGVNPSDDAKMRIALDQLPENAIFVVRPDHIGTYYSSGFAIPDTALVHDHPIAISNWTYNFLSYVESGPYWTEANGKRYPSLSSELSGVHSSTQGYFYPDFSIDPTTIPTQSAFALLNGRANPAVLTGKTVVLTSSRQSEELFYFGHRAVNAVAFDIAGAEALKQPVNGSLSPFGMLLLVFALLYAGHKSQGRQAKRLAYGSAVLLVLVLPILLRRIGLVAYPDLAIFDLLFFAGIRAWQRRTRKIQQTNSSGLPNMLALSSAELPIGYDVVVAAVARYEEMLATLPRDLHGECARQIARRIAISCGAQTIFHSDGGHFAWTEEARPLDMQLSHLEGLRGLFAAPLLVGAHTFDTNIHFGLDRNEGVATATRVNSALASANEALSNGRTIELFEANRLAEAPWELSLHARIDEGLRNGDIWLAFQAQWDIARHRICGAEALIRWNHPTRGPIAPDAFILQAERAGRIDALTYWVLDQAITATQAMNDLGDRFQMSVNLSGQLVDKPELVKNFADIVARRDIDPSLITIEVTETSSVGNRPAAVHNLTRLRQMGFRLSIDDFGTGEASLTYLADLPSDELKLDRRFVSRMVTSHRERVIVSSTIGLAHALGQVVVAEGIEDLPTLELLRDMGCDHAQGFYLGRPQPFAVFQREYVASRQRHFGSV